MQNPDKGAVNSTNSATTQVFGVLNTTNSPSVEVQQSVEVSTPTTAAQKAPVARKPVVVFEIGHEQAAAVEQKAQEEATKRAARFAAYALLGEAELAHLDKGELQAYKLAMQRLKGSYESRLKSYQNKGKNTSNTEQALRSAKMRLAIIDRAQALKEGEL